MALTALTLFVGVTAAVLLALTFRDKSPAASSIERLVTKALRGIFFKQWLIAVPTVSFLIWVLKYPASAGSRHEWLLLLALVVAAAAGLFTDPDGVDRDAAPRCAATLWCPNCRTALREPHDSSIRTDQRRVHFARADG